MKQWAYQIFLSDYDKTVQHPPVLEPYLVVFRACLLAFSVLVFGFYFLLKAIQVPAEIPDVVLSWILWAAGISLFPYFLARSKYYQAAAIFFGVIHAFVNLAIQYSNPNEILTTLDVIVWLLVPLMVGSLVLDLKVLFALTFLYLGIFGWQYFRWEIEYYDEIVSQLFFFLVGAALVHLSTLIRFKVQRALEANHREMLRASKLQTLGELAGNVAHEIGNPLTSIQLYLPKLKRLYTDENATKVVEKIEKNTDRIVKIIRGLRLLSRGSETDEKKVCVIQSVILDTLEIVQHRFERVDVQLKLVMPEAPIECRIRAAQIGQVVANLVNNAFDAISIGTEQPWIEVGVSLSSHLNQSVPQFIEVWVMDSGKGLSSEVQAKLFTPYFTTKGPELGTGIGLNLSRQIIHEHEGDLRYDASSPNTRFVFTLPGGTIRN